MYRVRKLSEHLIVASDLFYAMLDKQADAKPKPDK
jgi:hypothetical protein